MSDHHEVFALEVLESTDDFAPGFGVHQGVRESENRISSTPPSNTWIEPVLIHYPLSWKTTRTPIRALTLIAAQLLVPGRWVVVQRCRGPASISMARWRIHREWISTGQLPNAEGYQLYAQKVTVLHARWFKTPDFKPVEDFRAAFCSPDSAARYANDAPLTMRQANRGVFTPAPPSKPVDTRTYLEQTRDEYGEDSKEYREMLADEQELDRTMAYQRDNMERWRAERTKSGKRHFLLDNDLAQWGFAKEALRDAKTKEERAEARAWLKLAESDAKLEPR